MGFTTLLLAHISFDIPYVILNVLPKLRQMDRSLIDAAQDLGCTWMGAFWRVVVPEIKPGIVSGALMVPLVGADQGLGDLLQHIALGDALFLLDHADGGEELLAVQLIAFRCFLRCFFCHDF